jgi:acetyltransferase
MTPPEENRSFPDYRDALVVGGTRVTIRTICPADRDIEQQFVRGLSPSSRYYRFHTSLKELTPAMLERFTHVNYPDEMALIATIPEGAGESEIGVARYARYPGTDRAEVAVVVADAWQGKGIGARLLLDLRNLAREAGIRQFEASVLPGNKRMLELAQSLGFTVRSAPVPPDTTLELGKDLDPG